MSAKPDSRWGWLVGIRIRRSAASALAALLLGSCAERPGGQQLAIAAGREALPQPAGARADSVRDAHAAALRHAASASTDSGRRAHLASARMLAQDYATAWNDSFLVRRVVRFEAASSRERQQMAAADSLWRAGRESFGREGVPFAMELWRESLRHATAARDSAGRAIVLGAIGAGFYATGELDSATYYLDAAYRLATVTGDHRTRGNALGNLASVSKDRGALARAAEQYAEAAAIRPRSGDTRGMASDQNNLGLVAWALGDLAEARAGFERALELNRANGYDRYAALNLANLGDVASLDGDYAAADAYYREALSLNRAAGEVAEVAFVLGDLGLLSARRGDFRAAADALTEALALHEQAGATLEAISVRSDLAAVQAAMGELQRATASLRGAQRAASAAALPPDVEARLLLASADLAYRFGRLADAEADYLRAEQLFGRAGGGLGSAEAQQGRAVLRLLRGDHAGALELLELAVRRQRSAGERRAPALSRLLVAEVQRELGDTAAARTSLSAALDTLRSLGDLAGEVAAMSALADLAAQRGSLLSAEAQYRAALQHLGTRELPQLRWRLHAGLGDALRRRGALGPAAEQLRVAVATFEHMASGLGFDERRAAFLADKWQVYATLAGVEHARGRSAEAFAVSERLRGRRMLAMLARGRVASRNPVSEREQDVRHRIDELMSQVQAGTERWHGRREPALGREAVDAAREALDASQKEYAELLRELRDAEPGRAQLVAAEPVAWRSVARRLERDAVLLQYLLTDSTALVFVVTRDTVAAIDLGVAMRELRHLTDFARMAMGRPGGAQTTPLWRAPLRRLYDHLIQPVALAGFLEGKRTLVIVPHADLNFVPFGALLMPGPADRFLVERFHIGYAPSASAWVRLGDRASGARRSSRVLALAPHTRRLPGSAAEVAGIRAVFGRRATVLSDGAATETAFRDDVGRYGILHLATFGVLNKHNPLFSHVELAAERGADGRLEVHEVYDLGLDGQLVVLSACQTGLASGALADVPLGDDWVGLMQAFLEAGAGGVLASQWPVEDQATARLMQHFYRRLASGQAETVALAEAQRAMLREARTAHPFYWAGFVLNGVSPN